MHRFHPLIVFLIVITIFPSFLFAQNPSDSTSHDTLVIVGVGDVMLGTIISSRIYLPAGEDCSKEFTNVKDILQKADVTFCNLEGVFTDTLTITNPAREIIAGLSECPPNLPIAWWMPVST